MVAFGDTLRQARAQKGVSLKEAEQVTRINRHHLQALEDENFGALPPLIYQRGIVRNYATYLGLDANKLLAMFEEAHGLSGNTEVIPAVKPLDMPSHWAPNFAIIAFMVVMSAVVFAWVYSAYFAPSDALPTATEPIVTVTPVPTNELILPPTPVPPTATPSPTSPPSPTPTRTPRRVTIAPTPVGNGAVNQATAPVVGNSAANQTNSPAGTASTGAGTTGSIPLTIRAQGSDVTVTVIADGQTVASGETIADGDSSETFHANHYEVTTSDPAHTWYVTENGTPFQMDGSSFTLP